VWQVPSAHGDQSLIAFNRRCDDAVRDRDLDVAVAEPQTDAWPDPHELQSPIRSLDLAREGVTSVIWAHGAVTDFSWIDLPVFGNQVEPKRMPVHQRGVTAEPGLYFLGLPWLHKWKSAFLFGADEDAAYLAEQVASDGM
jgi:putative flavoprotein involved in K+ transport